MGTKGNGEQATICREGCAMSCVAMALASHGFAVPCPPGTSGDPSEDLFPKGPLRKRSSDGSPEVPPPQLRCPADPATLNSYLQAHLAVGESSVIVADMPLFIHIETPTEGRGGGAAE